MKVRWLARQVFCGSALLTLLMGIGCNTAKEERRIGPGPFRQGTNTPTPGPVTQIQAPTSPGLQNAAMSNPGNQVTFKTPAQNPVGQPGTITPMNTAPVQGQLVTTSDGRQMFVPSNQLIPVNVAQPTVIQQPSMQPSGPISLPGAITQPTMPVTQQSAPITQPLPQYTPTVGPGVGASLPGNSTSMRDPKLPDLSMSAPLVTPSTPPIQPVGAVLPAGGLSIEPNPGEKISVKVYGSGDKPSTSAPATVIQPLENTAAPIIYPTNP